MLNMLMDIAKAESVEVELTRENIKAFILNVFVAGTDNVALAPEWGLAELINHPDVMKKAQAEIDQVVRMKRLVQESDVPNLPYLQAIIKETLRLHQPVLILPRQSTEDHGSKLMGNPLEFRPERFLEKQMDVRGQHYDFLPFGSGRRMSGIDGNLTRVDMDEGLGLNLPRANPLVCIPVARLDPILLSNQGEN
ncbi:cytochrome P450 93A3-like protein [Tanacetum coccineum]